MRLAIGNYTARLASEVDSEAVYAFLEPYVCLGDRWSVERAQRRLKSFVNYYINKDACVLVENLDKVTLSDSLNNLKEDTTKQQEAISNDLQILKDKGLAAYLRSRKDK